MSLLRVLVFHGFRQSDVIFKGKTGALRQRLRRSVDFTYICAPNPYSVGESEHDDKDTSCRVEEYAWWRANDDGSVYHGVEETLTHIRRVLRDAPVPFDGFLGFSQGAVVVSVLAAMRGTSADVDRLIERNCRFVWLVGGLPPRAPSLQSLFPADGIALPSLHVIGQGDKMIPADLQRRLAGMYQSPVIHCHSGGHFVPATAADATAYASFLASFSDCTVQVDEDCGDAISDNGVGDRTSASL